jgi:hypothetical protein
MTMQLIKTKTLLSAAASIEFTSIPQDGTDLVALVSARGSDAVFSGRTIDLAINGSTAGFTTRRLLGSGSTVSTASFSIGFAGSIPTSLTTANTFSNVVIHFTNYTSSVNKSFSVDSVTENNATEAFQVLFTGLWANTSAINSISLAPNSGTFNSGTSFALYGIEA